MAGQKALVSFDYKPEAPDELGLKVGDIITGVEQVEEGWCRGSLNGKKGMFPDNFVKIIEEKPKPVAVAQPKQKRKIIRKVKVTFPYDPVNEDELKLETGDIIDVIHDEEEGWATGILRDKKGAFPTNFTEVVTSKQQQPAGSPVQAPAPLSPPPNEGEKPKIEKPKVEEQVAQPAQSKKVKGIGFGNIFGEGPIKLRQSSFGNKEDKNAPVNEKPVTPVQPDSKPIFPVTPTPKGVHHPPKKTTKPPPERCVVMFDYAAETNDELTLVKDDVIVIIDKESGDEGWWEGEMTDENGKKVRGVFPDNFVKLLPPVENDITVEKTPVKEKELVETKTKQKVKVQETEESVKLKPSPSSLLKGNSLKRVAPQAPLVVANNKPVDQDQKEGTDFNELNSSNDPQLTHYKRAGGPANRRKPNATGRRERAKEITEEQQKEMPEVESEPENEKVEPEPHSTPKRESTIPKGARGIQVMPSAKTTPEGAQTDAPSWLKNLRTRNSVKKPTDSALSAAVSPPNKEETPSWMTGLKKNKPPSQKPKPNTSSVSPNPFTPPAKPSQPVIPPARPSNHMVPKPVATTTTAPSTNHGVPPPHPAPPSAEKIAESHEKTNWKKSAKSKSESSLLASEKRTNENNNENSKPAVAVETKKPMKPPGTALQPPKMPPAARPKPPTPKIKPQLPTSKPVSGGALDELKDEIKHMREMIANMQIEHKREVASLQHDLNEEKKHRELLEIVVSEMGKQIGSLSSS